MKWSELKQPEEAFGKKEKNYNYGGEVARERLGQILTSNEMGMLNIALQCIINSSTIEDSEPHCMLVGSALTKPHFDLDIICCTDPPNNRHKVTNTMSKISEVHFMNIERRTTHNKLLTERKLFMHRNFVYFDISFAGIDSGTWEDIKQFHERTQLSHCVLL